MLAIQKHHQNGEITPKKHSLNRMLYSGLWAIQNPQERFLIPPTSHQYKHFFYESRDGHIAPIYHLPRIGRRTNPPILILTGPLFHPQVCISPQTPAIRRLRELGRDVYLLTHRGHSSSSLHKGIDHSMDAIAREDITAALSKLREYTSCDSFCWMGQGLGGILALIWVAQSGFTGIHKLILINTPVHFAQYRVGLLRITIQNLPQQVSLQRLLRLQLALNPNLDLSEQERSWLFNSASSLNLPLFEQFLQWTCKGQICDLEGEINYLKAIPIHTTKLCIYSSNSEIYGGHESCYPLAAWTKNTWIEEKRTEHFPLFSSPLSRLLPHCE